MPIIINDFHKLYEWHWAGNVLMNEAETPLVPLQGNSRCWQYWWWADPSGPQARGEEQFMFQMACHNARLPLSRLLTLHVACSSTGCLARPGSIGYNGRPLTNVLWLPLNLLEASQDISLYVTRNHFNMWLIDDHRHFGQGVASLLGLRHSRPFGATFHGQETISD